MFSGRKDKSAKQQTRAALSKPPRDAGRHTKAFICYAREDLAFVRANLVPGLEAHHIDCDWDFEALRAGDDWRARIEEVMEQSDAFLFIMSPHSITSPACLQELFFAEQHVKRVVPVVLDESVMDRVPPTLSRLHYSFLSDPQQYSSAIADLASTVNTDIGWVREHTRIATLARRWRNANRSPDLVLRGKALESAQTWLDNEPLPGRHKLDAPAPTGLQHEFLSASKRATLTRGRRHAVGILVLMLLAVWSLYTVLHKHRETAVRDSQRLASLADDFTASGDAAKGLLVALRAIPRRVMHKIGRDNRFNDAIASVYNGLHSLREELFAGGHDQIVYSIHLSPDGGQLATTSRDGSARLWDISTRALIRRFDVYPPDTTGKKKQQVWNAVFTKDGRNLITGSQDGKLLIWPLDGRPRTSLRGHTSSVNRHTVSPGDGRWLASVSDLGILRIYDLRAPDRDPREVGQHDGVAHTVAFDTAAKRLITASSDGTARVWDVATGRQLLRLEHARHGRRLKVYKAIFSPDGRQILTATANPGNHARLYDSATGELLAKLRHKHTVADIAFSRDGTRILTASYDKTAIVWSAGSRNDETMTWSPQTGKRLAILRGHTNNVRKARFCEHNATLIATSALDRSVRVWHVPRDLSNTAIQIAHFQGHGDKVRDAVFVSDCNAVVTISDDSNVRIWNLRQGIDARELSHDERVHRLAFSPDSRLLASASKDKTARIWDVASGQQLHKLEHDGAVRSVAFSPDGRQLLTASHDSNVRLWNPDTGRLTAILKPNPQAKATHKKGVNFAIFSDDGLRLVSVGRDGAALVWDARTLRLLHEFRHGSDLLHAAFSRDGGFLVTASTNWTAIIWDLATGEVRHKLKHRGTVQHVAVSPDSRLVASAGHDNKARLWNAATGMQVGADMSHDDIVRFVEFSADGRFIATASRDDTARVWDATDGTWVNTIEGHDRVSIGVTTARFAKTFPTDRKNRDRPPPLLTAGWDKTARISDPSSGRAMAVMKGHADVVTDAIYSPNGRWVATSSSDNTVRMWRMFPELSSLVAHACKRVPLRLSDREIADLQITRRALGPVTGFLEHAWRWTSRRIGSLMSDPHPGEGNRPKSVCDRVMARR